ncbi:MAG: hypothetical protein HQK87_06635, partial [Nitrospinae bacterium]|nr:hypothetical protein [Nitrospinota bacterium]
MDFWILAQLGVDILLFGMIALILIRDNRSPSDDDAEGDDELSPPPAAPTDTAALERLLDDMARMVNRAEKIATRLESAGKEAARLQTALETPPP